MIQLQVGHTDMVQLQVGHTDMIQLQVGHTDMILQMSKKIEPLHIWFKCMQNV